MYNLKGFYGYPSLVNNAPDQVAMFGELSDNSKTYAKDKTFHTSASTPNTTFTAFHSVKDDLPIQPNATYQDRILKIGKYMLDQSVLGAVTSDGQVLRQLVLAEFAATLTSFSTGKMLFNGTLWLPEYVVCEFSGMGETNRVQVWLCDNSFAGQFDEYVIEIVHPIVPYDNFFKDPLVVAQLLAAYSMPDKLAEVQALRAQYPYTYQSALMFEYQNPSNTTFKVPAFWIPIVYGVAGNNIDLIKQAIVDDIMANTTHTQAEWAAILPDLFRTTEFIITPFWKQYSIPNRTYQAGIYSPTVDPRTNLTLIRRTARPVITYTSTWVNAQYELSQHIYKSLAFSVVGNPQNRDGVVRFSKQFTDYMVVTNDGADFDRITPLTQDWMTLFAKLLLAAEEMDMYSSVPVGVSRIIRDGVVYASAFYKNINYLVVCRASVEALS